MACPVAGEMASGCRKTLFWHFSITKFARKLLNVRSPQARISVASFGGKGHSSPTLIFPPKVKCHSPADLPMPSCTSFPPHTPLQLLSSRRSGAEPCTAQRSGGGATSSFDLLKRALFHNALTGVVSVIAMVTVDTYFLKARRLTASSILLVPPKIPPQPRRLPSAKKAVERVSPSPYSTLTQLFTKSLPCFPYET